MTAGNALNTARECAILCYWLLAISRWLAFGNPTLLRLGNSNKFDCSRLNRSVGWLTQNRDFKEVREVKEFSDRLRLCVYSDLGCCRKAVKWKRDLSVQACLKTEEESLFCFNNSQSYPKSASAQKRNKVSQKVFARPAFFKKRAVRVSRTA